MARRSPAGSRRSIRETRAGVTSSSSQPVLDGSAFDDDDGLAGSRTQGSREVVRVLTQQRCATAPHLVGVDEESRHGSVHGAAPVSRYGGRVAEERLIARTADGTGLSVVINGTGDPLLLIPGLGAGRSAFDHLVPDLAATHRVITFDPRGIGEFGRQRQHDVDGDGARRRGGARCRRVPAPRRCSAPRWVGSSRSTWSSITRIVSARLILAATAPGGDDGVDAAPADQAALLGKGAKTPEDAYRIACTVLYSPQFQRTHPDFIEAQIRDRARHPVRPRVFSAQYGAMWQPDHSFDAARARCTCRHSSCTAPTTWWSRSRTRGSSRGRFPARGCVRSTGAGTCSFTSVPRRPSA